MRFPCLSGWWLGACLLQTGCALPPLPPGSEPATAPLQASNPARPITFTGRLSLKVAATPNQAARSISAAFEAQGDDQAGELRLSTPLGTQLALARWNPAGATLDLGHGATTYPSLEALAQDALGEPVPLQAVLFWLQGRAWPGAPAADTNTGFAQLGWQVAVTTLASQGELLATRSEPPELRLRILLER